MSLFTRGGSCFQESSHLTAYAAELQQVVCKQTSLVKVRHTTAHATPSTIPTLPFFFSNFTALFITCQKLGSNPPHAHHHHVVQISEEFNGGEELYKVKDIYYYDTLESAIQRLKSEHPIGIKYEAAVLIRGSSRTQMKELHRICPLASEWPSTRDPMLHDCNSLRTSLLSSPSSDLGFSRLYTFVGPLPVNQALH
ncbi:hypothetical protein YC2023_006354 [Brassica napus]